MNWSLTCNRRCRKRRCALCQLHPGQLSVLFISTRRVRVEVKEYSPLRGIHNGVPASLKATPNQVVSLITSYNCNSCSITFYQRVDLSSGPLLFQLTHTRRQQGCLPALRTVAGDHEIHSLPLLTDVKLHPNPPVLAGDFGDEDKSGAPAQSIRKAHRWPRNSQRDSFEIMNLLPCFKPRQQKLLQLMNLRPRLTRDVSGLPFSLMSTDIKSTFRTSGLLLT